MADTTRLYSGILITPLSGSLPASGVVAGQLYLVNGVLSYWSGSAWVAVSGATAPTSSRQLWVQAANSAAVADTTASTQFDQTYTAPANTAAAGDKIVAAFGGTFEVAADSALGLIGYVNDVNLLLPASDPILAAAGFASGRWSVKYQITFPSAGLQRIETQFAISYAASSSLYEVKQQITTGAVAPTGAIKLGAGVAWGVANAGNTITQTFGSVEIVKAAA